MSYKGTFRRLVPICALLAASTLPAFAQFDSGAFIGTVHDTSGAIIPGATVVVSNPQTRRRRNPHLRRIGSPGKSPRSTPAPTP